MNLAIVVCLAILIGIAFVVGLVLKRRRARSMQDTSST